MVKLSPLKIANRLNGSLSFIAFASAVRMKHIDIGQIESERSIEHLIEVEDRLDESMDAYSKIPHKLNQSLVD